MPPNQLIRVLHALLPGIRVVKPASFPAVEDVERAPDAGAPTLLCAA